MPKVPEIQTINVDDCDEFDATVFDNPAHIDQAFVNFFANKSNGSFTQNLIQCFFQADQDNFKRLGKVFPTIADAITYYKTGKCIFDYPKIRDMVMENR